MKLTIHSGTEESTSLRGATFRGLHPMFQYQVEAVPQGIADLFRAKENFIIIGMGGSVLPLKVFVDANAWLRERVWFCDSLNVEQWNKVADLPKRVYCVASKSGETLEIKAYLKELLKTQSDILVVTDPKRGFLRAWADDNKIPSLPIPPELGGRFTQFTVFHRALLERAGVPYDSLLNAAKIQCGEFKKDSRILQGLFDVLMGDPKKDRAYQHLILWAYGQEVYGLSEWMQQAFAESLGKKSKTGRRVGVLPTVLRGPQDQHSVLQHLMEGPQDHILWFLSQAHKNQAPSNVSGQLPSGIEDLKNFSMDEIRRILLESTVKSFEERLAQAETKQPVIQTEIEGELEDLTRFIVLIQALIEFSADQLGINAFDQPGVERGKQIARDLISERSKKKETTL